MTDGTFVVQQARAEDAAVIARHRARMFSEMQLLAPERTEELMEKADRYLRMAMPRGEYVGWLAREGDGGTIIGGAGVQVRNTLPHPRTPPGAPHGREAIVLNVYTEPAWRGRGVADRLMRQVIAWRATPGSTRWCSMPPKPVAHCMSDSASPRPMKCGSPVRLGRCRGNRAQGNRHDND